MRRQRNVKIVATLGPASNDKVTIRELFDAGADVFRLNMSHGSHTEIGERHRIIREIEAEVGRPIGILADLQGPKLRVGVFQDDEIELEEGQQFRLDLDGAPGDARRVQLPHKEIFEALEPGPSCWSTTEKSGCGLMTVAKTLLNARSWWVEPSRTEKA